MIEYIASIPNPGTEGKPKFLHSDDPNLVARWVKAEDRPGFSIYVCLNPLKPGAMTHGKDNIAAITWIFIDLDFRDIVETPEQIDKKLTELWLTPTEIADSGHGRHVKYALREEIPFDDPAFERVCALQAILIRYLAGDPQVRPWSLLRRTGTTNSKHEPHVQCRVLRSGGAVDLTELEDLCSIAEAEDKTLLTYREKPASNGHATSGYDTHNNERQRDFVRSGPVDVEAELAAMTPGEVNAVQCRVIPSLMWKTQHPDEIHTRVVDATMAMAERHGLAYDHAVEVKAVRTRILSAYNNLLLKNHDYYSTGEIPPWLPGEFHKAWVAKLQEGGQPVFGFNPGGYYLRNKQGIRAQDGTAAENSGEMEAGEPHARRKKAPPAGKALRLELRPFKLIDIGVLPPRKWLYGRHYQRRTVSLTAGPGGMGKSSLDLGEAVAMATCRNLFGEQPEERLRVWYHNGEDPREEIDRRIFAICQHYDIPQQELEGQLWTTSGTEFPLRVAKGYNNLEVNTELVEQISAAVADNEIDLIIFDPFVTLHSVSELDPGKMDAVIRVFTGIADENDTAIELVHHVRKPAAGNTSDYDVHDIRGVGAITDAVRAARVLNRMNEKDAEAAGCSELERLSRFRVDRAKGNYSPAKTATWCQFINVELGNGDEVGVVAPWSFPGQGGAPSEQMLKAERTAEAVFMELLFRLTGQGRTVSDRSGVNYAPLLFSREKEAKDAKISKAAFASAMRRLFAAKRIRAEDTGQSGHRVHCIVVV